MNGKGIVFLGLRYLLRNRAKTVLLVGAFTLVWLLPGAIALVVTKVEAQLRARAAETPLLLGRSGSALELVFNGLYFTKPEIATLPMRMVDEISADGMARGIPVHSRYSAGDYRIVGTNPDYFRVRALGIAEGRPLLRLGECVVGSIVAREADIAPGDSLISSPETLFDLAGVYPLKMKVVGVLAPSGSPDDRAVFVDVKTCWVIAGLGHGHEEAEKTGTEERLSVVGDAGTIRLNASVVEYNEITRENAESFHFHGDTGDFPLTAVIVIPKNTKGQALVKGRYEVSEDWQLISPTEEMDELFATVFSVQRLVLWLLGGIGAATVGIGVLVFTLSHRLRRDEFRHLRHLGADLVTLRALVLFEGAFVVLCSLVLCGGLLLAIHLVAPMVIRQVIG